MQIQITLDGTQSNAQIAENLLALANRFVPAPTTATPGKTVKTKTAIVETESTDTDDETFGLDAADETEAEAEAVVITQKDIIKAFQVYATKTSREKAAKVLTKFGVKSVKDLKESQYAAVMTTLV